MAQTKVYGLFLFSKKEETFPESPANAETTPGPMRIVAEEETTAIQIFEFLHQSKWAKLKEKYFYNKAFNFKKTGTLIEKIT